MARDRVEQAGPAGMPPLYPPTVTPPPEVLPLSRFLPTFVRNPLRTLPAAVYEQPCIVVERNGRKTAWVTDPAMVERVLLHEHENFAKTPLERRIFEPTLGQGILTAEGPAWRWQRRTAAPLFRHQDLLGHIPAMTMAAGRQIERWRHAPPGSIAAVDHAMTDVTYEIITGSILAGTVPAEDAVIKREAHRLLAWVSWEIGFGIVGIPAWVWHPGKWPSRRAAEALRATVHQLLARRRREPAGAKDLLGRLLAARDPETGQPMSDDQLVDNLLTFLLAGHETTAKALTWSLYLMARSPQWQERIRREVVEVCGDRAIEQRDLGSLPVTTRVVKEALRLYPPAPMMSRMAAREVTLGGHRLQKDALVIIPVFAIHRHRRLWTDPDRFDPDRFLPEAEDRHLRTQFMPFGFGPRTCIGMAFAMIEATVLLASLVRAARFEWDGHHLPEPVSRVTLQAKGGMPLLVTVLGNR